MLGEPTGALARMYSGRVWVPVGVTVRLRAARLRVPALERRISSARSLVMLSVMAPPVPLGPPAKAPPEMLMLAWAREPPLSRRSVPARTEVPPE